MIFGSLHLGKPKAEKNSDRKWSCHPYISPVSAIRLWHRWFSDNHANQGCINTITIVKWHHCVVSINTDIEIRWQGKQQLRRFSKESVHPITLIKSHVEPCMRFDQWERRSLSVSWISGFSQHKNLSPAAWWQLVSWEVNGISLQC